MDLIARRIRRWLPVHRKDRVLTLLGVGLTLVGCAQVCRSVAEGREIPCPLSREDLHKVTAWMAAEVARSRQPFCWRHSQVKLIGRCRHGFTMIWPVCWENCAPGRKNCLAGCAASGKACRQETWEMIGSSLVLGLNVATLGRGSTATQVAKLSKIKGLAKGGGKLGAREHKLELHASTRDWVNDAVADFQELTTPEVDRELQSHFSGDALRWIKEQYALNHLALLLEAEGDQSARDMLADIASVDPTGIAGVVDAFSQPMCQNPAPFPTVQLRPPYRDAPAPPP